MLAFRTSGTASLASKWSNPKPVSGPVSLFQAFGFNKGSWSFPQLQPTLPAQVNNATQKQGTSSGGGGGSGGSGGGGGNPTGNAALGKQMAAAVGWTGAQWIALNNIVMAESGWSVTAANPSGAYGIPQALPGSKMASAGADWRTSARTQIKWMLGYIRSTYGNPVNAWNFHRANGWY